MVAEAAEEASAAAAAVDDWATIDWERATKLEEAAEEVAAAAATVNDRATIDWRRATKLGVEMKNILPFSFGEIGRGGGGCGGEGATPGFVLQERGEEHKLYFLGQ